MNPVIVAVCLAAAALIVFAGALLDQVEDEHRAPRRYRIIIRPARDGWRWTVVAQDLPANDAALDTGLAHFGHTRHRTIAWLKAHRRRWQFEQELVEYTHAAHGITDVHGGRQPKRSQQHHETHTARRRGGAA